MTEPQRKLVNGRCKLIEDSGEDVLIKIFSSHQAPPPKLSLNNDSNNPSTCLPASDMRARRDSTRATTPARTPSRRLHGRAYGLAQNLRDGVRKYENCSIASSGLASPPFQNLSQRASTCERSFGSVSILGKYSSYKRT